MFTPIAAFVRVNKTVVISVLKAQVMTGSPSSQALTLMAWLGQHGIAVKRDTYDPVVAQIGHCK
jgi:hypothetical protein